MDAQKNHTTKVKGRCFATQGGNRGEKYQQFSKSIQTPRVRKYWRMAKKTRKLDAARKKSSGRVWGNARRGAEVRWFDDGGKGRASVGVKRRRKKSRMVEGASGWNIGLWTGENKVQRDRDDGGGAGEQERRWSERERGREGGRELSQQLSAQPGGFISIGTICCAK